MLISYVRCAVLGAACRIAPQKFLQHSHPLKDCKTTAAGVRRLPKWGGGEGQLNKRTPMPKMKKQLRRAKVKA